MSDFAIPIELRAQKCPYWDYAKHVSNHTCNGCDCMTVGNNIDTIRLGIRVGKDRFCTCNADIHVTLLGILNTLNR